MKIEISTQFLNADTTGEKDVIETILHELAHAIAGVQHQHDEIWHVIAKTVGSTGKVNCDAFAPHKYQMQCPMGCIHMRHQLVKKVYTERTEGYATCPRHKHLPVLVRRISDSTFINTFTTVEDFNITCSYFRLKQKTYDKIYPTLFDCQV